MHRTTITLPDETATILQREAQRRRVSMSKLAREAIEKHLGVERRGKRKIPFAALGSSEHTDTSERIEELLTEEWSIDRDR